MVQVTLQTDASQFILPDKTPQSLFSRCCPAKQGDGGFPKQCKVQSPIENVKSNQFYSLPTEAVCHKSNTWQRLFMTNHLK